MANQIRDDCVGPHMLAYLALTADEPVTLAMDYLRTAHERLGWALNACRGAVAAEAQAEIAGVRLFLIALAGAANPETKTPVNLTLKRRKGRPRKTIVDVQRLRAAGRQILERKEHDGYHSAAYGAASEFEVDRTEAQAWASHLEHEVERLADHMKRMKLYRNAGGSFEADEKNEMRVYTIARRAVHRIDGGADQENELQQAMMETGLDRVEVHNWIREIAHVERWRRFNALI